MSKLIVAGALLLFALAGFAGDLPDLRLTPGVTNPSITPENISQNICKKGWSTKSIRPPAYYTNKLKKKQIAQYHYTDKNPRHYEEDHLISLEIGGNPIDPKNLWPQPRTGAWNAAKKDRLENELHKRVCAGTLPLRDAQIEISSNWILAYQKYVK